jgi:hypothetical protein
MTIQNLGKILFILLFSVNLFASNVGISISAPAIYKGESVSFTITTNSSDVEFPNITNIEGFAILGTSSSSSTSIINGSISKKISKTYTFRPTKDVVIPSFKIEVNGDSLKTDAKKISVIKPSQSKNGDKFIVELKLDKQNLKVGESTRLRVLFKRRVDANADKLNINEPKIANFWLKKIEKENKYVQGNYIIQEFDYLIFAQKAGSFTIDSIIADIGRLVQNSYGGGFFNDPFFNSISSSIKWEKIYSNSLNIKVQSLPNSIELYGDFHINSIVDKIVVKQNKPVNLTISIDGVGNIDDIQKFDLDLDDAVVYVNKPEINSKLVNDNYAGIFEQKIAIIANNDLTIPSFKLTYFDKLTQKIKTIRTKPIDIKVQGGILVKEQQPIVQKASIADINKSKVKTVIVKQNNNLQYLYFILGLFIGSVVTYFIFKQKSKYIPKKENNIIKLIKNTKDNKKLFEILLPYAKEHQDISDILKQLEENIYKKSDHKINKQKLYDIFL